MPTDMTAAWLADAVRHHQAGRSSEAERLYRQIVAHDAGHADAWHLLGALALDARRFDEAAESIGRAVELQPANPVFRKNLALAQQAAGHPDRAEASLRESLRLEPRYAEAAFQLGLLLHEQHRFDAAGHVLDEALQLQPQSRAGLAQVFIHRAAQLRQQRRPEDAATTYRQVLHWLPEHAEALAGLGPVLLELNGFEEARANLQAAVQLQPEAADVHHNLGIALYRSGLLADAVAALRRAVALKPDDPETHLVLGMALLAQGDWAAGWPEYEWRLRRAPSASSAVQPPRWDGGPLAGRTILLTAEQGFGDAIQFVRFSEPLRDQGARVLLQCQPELVRLLTACRFLDGVFRWDAVPPAYDVYAPLMSLPGLLHITLANLPASVPYLHAEPALVAHWCRRLADTEHLRVGIAWQGGSVTRPNLHKAVPLRLFERLARVEGVELVSVQKGPGTEQLAEQRFPVTVLDDDPAAPARDFAGTAAILVNLDIVITIDTAVAHLAGALGLPTWVLLPADADWRWLRGRDDSPWYPTMRLFRQSRFGEWEPVLEAVEAALRVLVPSRGMAG